MADLADALDPVLTNRRTPEDGDQADSDACSHPAAQTVLSGLVRTEQPGLLHGHLAADDAELHP